MNHPLSSKFLDEVPKPHIKLDKKDGKLISALSVNTRFTPTYLGKLIGLSKDSIRYRTKKLKEQKILLEPVLIVNPYAFSLQIHSIFLRVNNLDSKEELNFLKFLIDHPFVAWCGLVGGQWDIGMTILSKNTEHFNSILKEIKTKSGKNLVDFLTTETISLQKYENLPPEFRKQNDISIKLTKKDVSFQKFLNRPIVRSSQPPVQLEKKDLMILASLVENPNISIASISEKTNLSFDTVKNRIANLIKNQIILAFNPIINLTSLNLIAYILFIDTKDLNDEEKFEQFLQNHQNIVYIFKTHGRWDYQIYISTHNQYEFYAVLRDLRSKFSDNIRSYSTLSIIKDFKFTFFPEGIKEMLNQIRA